MTHRLFLCFLIPALLLALWGPAAQAQGSSRLQGEIFLDLNENGTRDAGESPVPGTQLVLGRAPLEAAYQVQSDAQGEYQVEVDPGTWYLAIWPPEGYGVTTRASQQIGMGGGTTIRSFGVLTQTISGQAPQPQTPTVGQAVTSPVAFQWSRPPTPGVAGYLFQIQDATGRVRVQEHLFATQRNVTLPEGDYQWRVRTVYSPEATTEVSDWSALVPFQVVAPPTPTATVPATSAPSPTPTAALSATPSPTITPTATLVPPSPTAIPTFVTPTPIVIVIELVTRTPDPNAPTATPITVTATPLLGTQPSPGPMVTVLVPTQTGGRGAPSGPPPAPTNPPPPTATFTATPTPDPLFAGYQVRLASAQAEPGRAGAGQAEGSAFWSLRTLVTLLFAGGLCLVALARYLWSRQPARP